MLNIKKIMFMEKTVVLKLCLILTVIDYFGGNKEPFIALGRVTFLR